MNKVSFAAYLSLLFVSVYISLEMLNIEVSNSILYGTFGLWLGSIVCFDSSRVNNIVSNKKYLFFILFLCFYFISSLFVIDIGTAFNRIISFSTIFSPILMYDYYYRMGKRFRLYVIFIFIILLLIDIPVLWNTIQESGLGLRVGNSDYYRIKNSFNLSYSFAILAPAITYIIANILRGNNYNKKWVLLLIVIDIGIVALVAMSMFVTAIVITIIGVILAFIYKTRNWIVKSIVAVVLASIFFVSFFDSIIGFISDSTVNLTTRALEERVDEINLLLTGEYSQAEDLNDRSNLGLKSLETFVANPLFGINHKAVNYESMVDLYLGNHSSWIDSLARYGLFALLLFSFLIRSGQRISKECKSSYALFAFATVGLFNPVFYFPQMSVTFLFIPFLTDIILDKNENII